MNRSFLSATVAASLLIVSASAFAQAPAGSTGQCKDGSYTSSASKKGACRGHQGVKDWYTAGAEKPAAAAAAAPAAAASRAPAAARAPVAAGGPAPAGSTGRCKDGSFTSAANKKGACRGHEGVQDWYAAAPAAAPAAPVAAPAAPAAAPVAAPVAAAAAAAAPSPRPPHAMPAMPAQAAPGGGPGLVWANESTKVYHCSTDKWYGKTKSGSYMTEADARAKGYHADHGRACQ